MQDLNVSVSSDGVDQSQSAILSYLGSDIDWLKQNLQVHDEDGNFTCKVAGFSLVGSDGDQLPHVVDSMLQAGALPGMLCQQPRFYEAAPLQETLLLSLIHI